MAQTRFPVSSQTRRLTSGAIACLLLASPSAARADQWTSIGPFAGQTATALAWDGPFLGGTFLYAAIDGAGVFRSPDLGSTWAPAGPGLTNAHPTALALYRMVLPPSGCPPPCGGSAVGPAVVYAATHGGGVFVLRDGAWTADNSGLTDLDVTALAADSIGVWAGTASGRVFRNIFASAGPQAWSRIDNPADGTPVLSLAAATDSVVFYGTEAGLYRSTNGGASWTRLQANTIQYLGSVRSITVDSNQPTTVYAAGILDCLCGVPAHPGVMKSTDDGETWVEITDAIANPFVNTLVVASGGQLFAGTSSGVARSNDGGSTWASAGLDGVAVTALTETPFPFSESVPMAAGTAGAGLYRADLPITAGCQSGSSALCLGAGRFRVEVSWTASNIGQSGVGQAMPLTSESGAFWFFQPSNIELVVKVLDGRAINGHYWVFYGALSNVGYTITVTDTATGAVQTYTNPEGNLASRADTEAF
ncbi:MAG: WD40/YVTN/BNR-like repeat-containing protein [Acidobacteriota bacterium]